MFTGIVEHVGAVEVAEPTSAGLRIRLDLGPLAEDSGSGDSIAVQGVCLTIVRLEGAMAEFDISTETLSLTTFTVNCVDRKVNLERALAFGGRVGGHFVSGHVDGLGTLQGVREQGDFQELTFSAPAALTAQMIQKGSVTVDGVSLTISALRGKAGQDGQFTVALIPETLARTTLSLLAVGDPVHLETDLLAKHLQRLQEVPKD